MSVASKMKMAGGAAFVILLLLSSMIFTNFGFYSGAGNLSVLIDVNEGKDPGDRTLDANILATSPAFGMLKTEGEYEVSFEGSKKASGKFDLNDDTVSCPDCLEKQPTSKIIGFSLFIIFFKTLLKPKSLCFFFMSNKLKKPKKLLIMHI